MTLCRWLALSVVASRPAAASTKRSHLDVDSDSMDAWIRRWNWLVELPVRSPTESKCYSDCGWQAVVLIECPLPLSPRPAPTGFLLKPLERLERASSRNGALHALVYTQCLAMNARQIIGSIAAAAGAKSTGGNCKCHRRERESGWDRDRVPLVCFVSFAREREKRSL